jgi:hypothetical protein
VKHPIADILRIKQQERERNAARTVVEKLRTLDRLREAAAQIKRAVDHQKHQPRS